MIIVPDMNLNKRKFKDKNYHYKELRDILLECVARNDLTMADLPNTYISKINWSCSEIDHVYLTSSLKRKISCSLDDCGASDHSPVLIEVKTNTNKPKSTKHEYKFIRSYKNFDQEKFNYDL